MSRGRDHWNAIYREKSDHEVSWFEPSPAVSLQLLEAAGLHPHTCVLDIGGGNSRLIDALLARGLNCLAVLDISSEAIERAKERLGDAASIVTWIEADVAGKWSAQPVDIWHDRAVFHFLTSSGDRASYREHMLSTVKSGGAAIIATFALDGPERCSGLPVVRYSPELLERELGPGITLVESRTTTHRTPFGTAQSFQYSWFALN